MATAIPGMSKAAMSPVTPHVDYQHTPDYPQMENIEKQDANFGLPQGYKELLVKTITDYRSGWAPDRILRIPLWMRNVLMFRGSQLLSWDPGNNTYFDAYAWFRQNAREDDGQDTYLEKYGNNITQMLEAGFVGTMSRAVPSTIVRPENAEILADITTAKAGSEAISIIERMNHIRQMLRIEDNLLYLYGCYFKYTRAVLDGDWAGWDYEDEFASITVTKPDRYHCFRCGHDTPVEAYGASEAKRCPFCNTGMGPESFMPSEQSEEITMAGQKRVPRAMVKWTAHGPMEIDVDPMAKTLADTPILAFDQEVDIGALRLTFPAMFSDLQMGAEVSTTPNASYEKLRRNEIYSMGWGYTSDSSNQKPTFSQVWIQPIGYGRIDDKDFSAWMLKNFPDGVKVSMVGSVVVDIKKATLVKQWSSCQLHDNVGMYPPAIADNVVPFNIRLNDTMDLIDDWIERCAAGMTLYDASKIDRREMAGRVMSAGVLNGVQTKGAGIDKPLGDSIMQFQFSLAPQVFTYPGMLINFCELISGVTPQTFGGGSPDNIETFGGQQQSVDLALTKLGIYWESIKEEHAVAAQNALECLQGLMAAGAVGELLAVIQSNGSEYRNKYVDWKAMSGRIRVYPDIDQGLPQSPAQMRQALTELVQMAGGGNPIATELLSSIANQETALSMLAPPGMVLPSANQRSRTLQAINTLMEKDAIGVADPQTGKISSQLPVMPDMDVDDFQQLRQIIREYMQENGDYERTNPGGWQRVKAYLHIAETMEVQQAVEEAKKKLAVQAASVPVPQKDPEQQAAMQAITADGAQAVQRLLELANLPPQPPGVNITPQVTAAFDITKTAIDAQRLQAGGK